MNKIITKHSLIDEIMDARRTIFGDAYPGVKNHAYHLLNFARCWIPESKDRDDKLAVCASFHDMAVFPDGNLDYLEPSVALAHAWLEETGHSAWKREIELMILWHHKIRSYSGESKEVVEPVRKADWIDVLLGTVRFGLDRSFVNEVWSALPVSGFLPQAVVKATCAHVIRHPLNPLPIFRW